MKSGLKPCSDPMFNIMVSPRPEDKGRIFVTDSVEKALYWADIWLDSIDRGTNEAAGQRRGRLFPKSITLLEIVIDKKQPTGAPSGILGRAESDKAMEAKALSIDETAGEDWQTLTDGGKKKNVDIDSSPLFLKGESKKAPKKGKRKTKAKKGRDTGGIPTEASEDIRQDKAGLTPEQEAVLQSIMKSQGYGEYDVRTLGSVMQAAKILGMDIPTLLKITAKIRPITDEETVALNDVVNTTNVDLWEAEKDFKKYKDEEDNGVEGARKKKMEAEVRMAGAELTMKSALSNLINGLTENARAMRAAQIIGKYQQGVTKDNKMDAAYWVRKAHKTITEQGRKHTEDDYAAALSKVREIAMEGTPMAMAEFIQGLKKPSLIQKLIALWKAGLLTAFKTHTANLTGTGIMSVLETVADIPATGIDMLVAQFTGKRTVTISPRTVAAKMRGIGIKVKFVKGVPKFTVTKKGALATAGRFFKTGVYSDEILSKYDLPPSINFEKLTWLNVYMKGVFRSLGAEDIFFREIAMMESLEKQAIVITINMIREGKVTKAGKNAHIAKLLMAPTKGMINNAINTAARVTFQNPNVVSDMITMAKSVSKRKDRHFNSEWARMSAEMTSAGIDIVAPFVRTPTNIAFRILDLSPVGFVKAAVRASLPSVRAQLKEDELAYARGAEGGPGLQQLVIEDISRGITGTTIIVVGAMLAAAGLMTGNAPEDQDDRDQFFLEGKKPNSVLLWGGWRSVNRVSPFGNLLAIGAYLWEHISKGKDTLGVASGTSLDAAKMISEQTFLQGVAGLLKAVNDPDRFGDAYANRMVGSMIPSIFNTAARIIDPFQRVPEKGLIGMLEGFTSRLPWLSKNVAMRIDNFGNPVKFPSAGSESIFGRALGLMLDPIPGSPQLQHPLLDEAERIGVKIGIPSKTISGIRLTNKEWEKFQRLQGMALEKRLTYVVRSAKYQNAKQSKKVEIWEKAEREVATAHNALAFPILMIKRYGLETKFTGSRVTAKDPYFVKIRKVLKALSQEDRFKNAPISKQRNAIINGLRQLGINHPLGYSRKGR